MLPGRVDRRTGALHRIHAYAVEECHRSSDSDSGDPAGDVHQGVWDRDIDRFIGGRVAELAGTANESCDGVEES